MSAGKSVSEKLINERTLLLVEGIKIGPVIRIRQTAVLTAITERITVISKERRKAGILFRYSKWGFPEFLLS